MKKYSKPEFLIATEEEIGKFDVILASSSTTPDYQQDPFTDDTF